MDKIKEILALVCLTAIFTGGALYANSATKTAVPYVSIETNNNASYLRRLEMIAAAKKTIDVAYYIYDKDYSSSYLTLKLLEKAQQGVRVRLLIDWTSTATYPEFFKMLVAKGGGNLEVAYFRAPSPPVIEDLKRLGVADPMAFLVALVSLDFKAALKELFKKKTLFRPKRKGLFQRAAQAKEMRDILPLLERWDNSEEPTAGALFDWRYEAAENAANPQKESREFFHKRAWFDMTKRLHHKVLISDSRWTMGGGRNIQDSYHWEEDHPIRKKYEDVLDFKYIFMDTDFYVDSAEIALEAENTFDEMWDCAKDGPYCLFPYGATLEKADLPETEIEAQYSAMVAKATEFAPYHDTIPGDPVHDARFEASNVELTYFENTMHPLLAKHNKYLYEIPSLFNQKWVEWIDATPRGSSILIHNAYLLLPSKLILAIIRAVKRGVKVLIHTNSEESSDLGFISKLARFQYRELLRLGNKHGGLIEIYEFQTSESLHSKVNVFGDDLITVSSVNADPRCEYLDTQNGVALYHSGLATSYFNWFINLRERLLKDGRMARITLPVVRAMEDEALRASSTQSDEIKTANERGFFLMRTITQNAFLDPETTPTWKLLKSERARHFLDMLFIQL